MLHSLKSAQHIQTKEWNNILNDGCSMTSPYSFLPGVQYVKWQCPVWIGVVNLGEDTLLVTDGNISTSSVIYL